MINRNAERIYKFSIKHDATVPAVRENNAVKIILMNLTLIESHGVMNEDISIPAAGNAARKPKRRGVIPLLAIVRLIKGMVKPVIKPTKDDAKIIEHVIINVRCIFYCTGR